MTMTAKECRRAIKTRTAIIIVLVGLVCGSVLVDVVQLYRGEGFTIRALRNASVVSYDHRTWVAYSAPPITAMFVTESCTANASSRDILTTWLRYVLPTVRIRCVDGGEAAEIRARADVPYLPAIVLNAAVTQTRLFAQSQGLFATGAEEGLWIVDVPFLRTVEVAYHRAVRHLAEVIETDAPVLAVLVPRESSVVPPRGLERAVRKAGAVLIVLPFGASSDDVRRSICAARRGDGLKLSVRKPCEDVPMSDRITDIVRDIARFGHPPTEVYMLNDMVVDRSDVVEHIQRIAR